jgi:hypothetical protein
MVGKEKILAGKTYFSRICQYTQRIDKAILQGHVVQVYNTMSREDTQILVQLRTNHIGLNRYKWRVKLQESASCECRAEQETVQHFLIPMPAVGRAEDTITTNTWGQGNRPGICARGMEWQDG